MSVRSGSNGGGVTTDVRINVVGAQEGAAQVKAVNTALDGTDTSGRKAGRGLDEFTLRTKAAAAATKDKVGALGKLQGAWQRANDWVGKVSASLGKFNFVLGAAGALGLLNMVPNALQLLGRAFSESDAQLERNAQFWQHLKRTIAEVDDVMARAAARASQMAAAASAAVAQAASAMGIDPSALSLAARSQIGDIGQRRLTDQERLNELQSRYNVLRQEALEITRQEFPSEGAQQASGAARARADRLDRRSREIITETQALEAEKAAIEQRLARDPFRVGGSRGGARGGSAARTSPESDSGPFQYLGMRQIGSGIASDMEDRARRAMARAQEAADYEAQFKLPAGQDDGDTLGIGRSVDAVGAAVDRLSPFTQAFATQMTSMADVSGTAAGMVVGAMTSMSQAVGTALTNLIVAGKAGEKGLLRVAGTVAVQTSAQAFSYSTLLGAMAAAAGIIGIPIFGATAGQLGAGAGIMFGAGALLAGVGRALGAQGIGFGGRGAAGGAGGGGISDAAPARRDPGLLGGPSVVNHNYNFGGAIVGADADRMVAQAAARGTVVSGPSRGGLRLQMAS